MIAESKLETFARVFKQRVHFVLLSLAKYCNISTFIYNILQLVECVQLFSYIYNCAMANLENSPDIIGNFSDISTYFRVIILFLHSL
ncbi:MAG: hypothetical protein P4M11_04830 [Candidatus Pacebacteria bacterium]|nr:hypothetical protein [Candidatus Paceibacterota bacterium]